MESASIAKQKKVTLGDVEVLVTSLKVRRYREVFSKFDKLGGVVYALLSALGRGENPSAVIGLLLQEGDELLEILAIATGVDKETLEEEADLVDLTELLLAVIEVNRFDLAKTNVGKIAAALFGLKAAA